MENYSSQIENKLEKIAKRIIKYELDKPYLFFVNKSAYNLARGVSPQLSESYPPFDILIQNPDYNKSLKMYGARGCDDRYYIYLCDQHCGSLN